MKLIPRILLLLSLCLLCGCGPQDKVYQSSHQQEIREHFTQQRVEQEQALPQQEAQDENVIVTPFLPFDKEQ